MSYDIRLTDPVSGETLHAPAKHFVRGGTYAAGGTTELWLNVTYNYATIFARVIPEREATPYDPAPRDGKVLGIRVLYGKTGAESIPMLKAAAKQLLSDVDPDYWKATEGNAKRALMQMLALAQMRPDGVWRGD